MKCIRIFFDTEFTDFTNMDMISIGMVAETGEEFYKENLDFIQVWSSQWVKDNIYPLLNHAKYGAKRFQIAMALDEFIESLDCDEVEFCADYQGDLNILQNLLESCQFKKPYKLVNFKNKIYFAVDEFVKQMGGSDTTYHNIVAATVKSFEKHFLEYFVRTGEIQHHALSDAKANLLAFRAAISENHLAC